MIAINLVQIMVLAVALILTTGLAAWFWIFHALRPDRVFNGLRWFFVAAAGAWLWALMVEVRLQVAGGATPAAWWPPGDAAAWFRLGTVGFRLILVAALGYLLQQVNASTRTNGAVIGVGTNG